MPPQPSVRTRNDEHDHVRVAAQARGVVGPELAAAERYYYYALDHLFPWPGRALDEARADVIVAAAYMHSQKTFWAALHLVRGGFGPQAGMLNRGLFEAMAVAHWASDNPSAAVDRFEKHRQHSEILGAEALVRNGWLDEPGLDVTADGDRQALDQLFGPHGERIWTGQRHLHALLGDIEHMWRENTAELWDFFRAPHRDNNHQLHAAATALLSSAVQEVALDGGPDGPRSSVTFDGQPSSAYLDKALLGALWCYAQMTTLIWDHFGLPGRAELDAEFVDCRRAFAEVDPKVARETGRNALCPCGSGKKYKKCHEGRR